MADEHSASWTSWEEIPFLTPVDLSKTIDTIDDPYKYFSFKVEVTDKNVHAAPPKLGYLAYGSGVIAFKCMKTGRVLLFMLKTMHFDTPLERFFINTLLDDGITSNEMLCLNSPDGNGVIKQW